MPDPQFSYPPKSAPLLFYPPKPTSGVPVRSPWFAHRPEPLLDSVDSPRSNPSQRYFYRPPSRTRLAELNNLSKPSRAVIRDATSRPDLYAAFEHTGRNHDQLHRVPTTRPSRIPYLAPSRVAVKDGTARPLLPNTYASQAAALRQQLLQRALEKELLAQRTFIKQGPDAAQRQLNAQLQREREIAEGIERAKRGTDPVLAGGEPNNPIGLVPTFHTGVKEGFIALATGGLGTAEEVALTTVGRTWAGNVGERATLATMGRAMAGRAGIGAAKETIEQGLEQRTFDVRRYDIMDILLSAGFAAIPGEKNFREQLLPALKPLVDYSWADGPRIAGINKPLMDAAVEAGTDRLADLIPGGPKDVELPAQMGVKTHVMPQLNAAVEEHYQGRAEARARPGTSPQPPQVSSPRADYPDAYHGPYLPLPSPAAAKDVLEMPSPTYKAILAAQIRRAEWERSEAAARAAQQFITQGPTTAW